MKSYLQQVFRLALAILKCYRHSIGLWYLGFIGFVWYFNYTFRSFEQLNLQQYEAGDFTSAMILLVVYNVAFSAYLSTLFQPKRQGSWIYEIPVRASVYQVVPMVLLTIHSLLLVAFVSDYWLLYMNLMGVSPFITLLAPSLIVATATLRFSVTWQRQSCIFLIGILYFWFVQSSLQPWTHQFGQWKAELHILAIIVVLTVLINWRGLRIPLAPVATVSALSMIFVALYAISTLFYPSQNPVELAASASYFRTTKSADRFVSSFLSRGEKGEQHLFHENVFLNDRFAIAVSRLSDSSLTAAQNEMMFKLIDRLDLAGAPLVDWNFTKQYLRIKSNTAINQYVKSSWRESPLQCMHVKEVYGEMVDEFLERVLLNCRQFSQQSVTSIVWDAYRPWLEKDKAARIEQILIRYLEVSSPMERERIMRDLYSIIQNEGFFVNQRDTSPVTFQLSGTPEKLFLDWQTAFVKNKQSLFERVLASKGSFQQIFATIDRMKLGGLIETDICHQVLDDCDDLNFKNIMLNPYERFYFNTYSFFKSSYPSKVFKRWYITQYGDLRKLDALIQK